MLYTEMITDNRLFRLCYEKGRQVISRNIVLYARKNHLPVNRLGITASKKIGNAVCRSRARRLIRQAWRENEINVPIGLDIVIVARAHITEIKSDALSRYLRNCGVPALCRIYEDAFPEQSAETS